MLVVNKIDLAPHVGANLQTMKQDAQKLRKEKPFLFVNCMTDQGVDKVADHIIRDVLFDAKPKAVVQN